VTRRLPKSMRAGLASLACATLCACSGGGSDDGGSGPLNITSTVADDGVLGAAYSDRVAVTGGQGTRTFSISAGALPAGLALSAAGNISGTPTGPAGTTNFTVSVSDSATPPATDTQALSIDIVEPLAITTAVLADTSVGDNYAASMIAVGGTAPYTFSVSEGALPDGVAISGAGALSGTVLAGATTGTFTIEAADSSSPQLRQSQSYTVRVALQITTTALADATGGLEYSDALVVQGGLPPYDWLLTAGTLPEGLAGPDAASGVISGTPAAQCASTNTTLAVQVSDSDAPAAIDTQAGIDLTVNPAALDITTAALSNAIIGAAYNQRVLAAGGVPPYSFAVTGGSLPSQLALNASTGRITGTPDSAEIQAFEVRVTDACLNTASQQLSITVTAASLGRNDSIATATTLPGDGDYQASISPSGHPNTIFDPDEDYYRITTTATSTITVDINAQVIGSPVDTVIEIVNAAGTVLNRCIAPLYNSPCVSDDEQLGVDLDSFLRVQVNGATTFYIHVVDWGSNARPDMLYELTISGVN
jgi:Putative Ig domain